MNTAKDNERRADAAVDRLHKAMRTHSLSDVAHEVKRTPATVALWLSGVSRPRGKALARLERWLS